MKNDELMLKELRYLQGKKIDRIRGDADVGFCIHFTSGNYCIFKAGNGYETDPIILLKTSLNGTRDKNLLLMEIITQEEYDGRMKIKDERNEPRRRAEYEKLKAEFGEDR